MMCFNRDCEWQNSRYCRYAVEKQLLYGGLENPAYVRCSEFKLKNHSVGGGGSNAQGDRLFNTPFVAS